MESRSPARSRGRCLVAMVLGTALSVAPGQAQAASERAQEAAGDMARYCSTCWRNARLPGDSWADCTQEVFRRLLERVPTEAWDRVLGDEGEERREFLRA